MPAVKAKTATKTRRLARKRSRVRRKPASAPANASYIVKDDRPTHVIIPIEEYDQLLDAIEAHQMVDELKNPKTKWISAQDAALELAGSWIARARKQAGLTQKQLAAKLRVPQSQISRIEKHPERSTVKTMQRIAKALGVDLAALMAFASE